MKNFFEERRFGRFFIPRHIVETDPEHIMLIMGKCVVVKAEIALDRDGYDYMAVSPDFAPLSPGSIAPTYNVEGTDKYLYFTRGGYHD